MKDKTKTLITNTLLLFFFEERESVIAHQVTK